MDWKNFSNWYREEAVVAQFPGGHELRLTIGVQAGADEALYRTHLNEAHDYIQQHHKTTPKALLDAEQPDQDALNDWNRLYARSYMLATLRRVETREPDGEWIQAEFPAEWVDCDGFGKHWPKVLHDQWRNVANALNPGLYTAPMDDEAKNAVRVVVGQLMS